MSILQKEAELKEIVQLVGPDALPQADRILLETARMLREDYLQQNAFHEVDSFCSSRKQFLMMDTILKFHGKCVEANRKGVPSAQLAELKAKEEISRMKYVPEKEIESKAADIKKEYERDVEKLSKGSSQ